MNFKPHAYQTRCIDAIVSRPAVGLFLDMGLGKTVITLTAINILKYERLMVARVLIIAPKKVAEGTWTEEAAKWDHTRHLRISPVLGPLKKRKEALAADADIYIINRENVQWLVKEVAHAWPFDMVVIDESSSFKSHSAKRFKALASQRAKIARVVELTGTPSPNGLMDLWTQIYLLDMGERFGKFFTYYRERYFEPDRRSYTGQVYSYRLRAFSEEAIMDKIKDLCISMKSEDYLTLPDLIENTVPVILDDDARKKYKELERQMIMELDDAEELTVLSAAALSNKLLQLANGAVYDDEGRSHPVHDCKMEAFGELLEQLHGEHALVFYAYKHDMERLALFLTANKINWRAYTGPDDAAAWNLGEIDVLLAHPASCAYGLNLQYGGRHVIWFGLTWNYELYSQANKRLHRQGQEKPVIIHHLVAKGTRDEDVMRALEGKDTAQERVLESLKERIKHIQKEIEYGSDSSTMAEQTVSDRKSDQKEA